MGVGMIFAVIAFLFSAGLQYKIDSSPKNSVGVFWQIPQIIIISIAEILISVTGLEFAYTQAPTTLKSIITSLFLVTTAIGNLFTGVLYNTLSKKLSFTMMFIVFAALMFANFFAFLFVSIRFKPAIEQQQQHQHQQQNQQQNETQQQA
jgi:dipeptide/tripeptide permease